MFVWVLGVVRVYVVWVMCEFARGIVPPVKGEVVHQRFLRGLSVQMEKAH